jgi:Tol biopolymer transport system component
MLYKGGNRLMRIKTDFKSLNMSKLWFTMSMLVILSLLIPCTVFAKGKTTRVSISSSGTQGNDTDYEPSISSDGRYVAFESFSDNLVAGDTNSSWDIFVHDRQDDETTRVSVSSAGEQGNNHSWYLSISADGRYVAFRSDASNLVANDNNGAADIFVRDLQDNKTTRVSVSTAGDEGNGDSFECFISPDGRYVVFESDASNLVSDDTNGSTDIFVHDRESGNGTTTRVSISSGGDGGNSDSFLPTISADGRYVAFESDADNLVSGDTNGSTDIFVHDLQDNKTTRVSVSSAAAQGNGDSRFPFISSDGHYVAFYSKAANLVSGDSNGSEDVFLHNLDTDETTRLTDSAPGVVEPNHSRVSISSDNRFVVFESNAENLVPGDDNGLGDIFMYDLQTAKTTRVSVSTAGVQANGLSHDSIISLDGRHIAYESEASNLVTGDDNGMRDIFVYDLLTGNIVAQISLMLLD